MRAIAMAHVTKTYGHGLSAVTALRNASFAADAGELIGVVGPSGSGKSTFLQIAGGLLTPTSGSVTIEGRAYHDLSVRQRERLRLNAIGFVLQAYSLVPYLTVNQQYQLVDKVKNTPNLPIERFHEITRGLGIDGLGHQYPGTLSGGQRQRVAIARALYADPRIILADEPTASLDSRHAFRVMETLQRLAHVTRKAIIVVTHDTRLERYADRLYTITDGALSELVRA